MDIKALNSVDSFLDGIDASVAQKTQDPLQKIH